MPTTDKFFAINTRKYLALGDDEEAGEPALVKLLSGFSCPKNLDVERFLKKLLSSYCNNRFSQFDPRQTAAGADEPHEQVNRMNLYSF